MTTDTSERGLAAFLRATQPEAAGALGLDEDETFEDRINRAMETRNRGMRIAVEHILGMLAAGDTAETILREYPQLEPEDIQACLQFARRALAGDR